MTQFRTDLFATETATLGQGCTFMELPWIAFRGGSDLMQTGDATDDYKKYGPITARHRAIYTLILQGSLRDPPTQPPTRLSFQSELEKRQSSLNS